MAFVTKKNGSEVYKWFLSCYRVISPVGLGDISKGHSKQLIYLQQLLPRPTAKSEMKLQRMLYFPSRCIEMQAKSKRF